MSVCRKAPRRRKRLNLEEGVRSGRFGVNLGGKIKCRVHMTAARRLTAILAADVAGYSRLMGADEAGTRAGAGGPPLPAIIPNESRRALKWRSCSRALEDSGRPLPGMEYSGRPLPDSPEPAGYSDKSGDLNRASSAGSTTSSSFHDSALAS